MSIPDNLIYSYFELVTNISAEDLTEVKEKLNTADFNPMELKKNLGEIIVEMYHSHQDAIKAREEFEKVFSKGELPDEIPEFDCAEYGTTVWIVRLLTDSGMASSNGDARRLIKGGGVSIDGSKATDENLELKLRDNMLLKVGKRRFLRLRCGQL
jgi:tyrosyl-tRNA synthetase